MIATLADAWAWYEAVRDLAYWMDRFARRYWDAPELAEILGKDDKFRALAGVEIQDKARKVITDLDDLAVLLLFSVFEAEVRGRTLESVEKEIKTPPRHPAFIDAIAEMKGHDRERQFRAAHPDL